MGLIEWLGSKMTSLLKDMVPLPQPSAQTVQNNRMLIRCSSNDYYVCMYIDCPIWHCIILMLPIIRIIIIHFDLIIIIIIHFDVTKIDLQNFDRRWSLLFLQTRSLHVMYVVELSNLTLSSSERTYLRGLKTSFSQISPSVTYSLSWEQV